MNVLMAMIEFISKASSAGVVNAQLGFAPDFAILIVNHGGTNPDIYLWANSGQVPGWATALALLITGSTGVVTRVTSGPTVFAGGTVIATAEGANNDPKHIDNLGKAVGESGGVNTNNTVPFITQAGLAIPAALQTASGRNLLIAFRRNR